VLVGALGRGCRAPGCEPSARDRSRARRESHRSGPGGARTARTRPGWCPPPWRHHRELEERWRTRVVSALRTPPGRTPSRGDSLPPPFPLSPKVRRRTRPG
jgi:hypothetical protein